MKKLSLSVSIAALSIAFSGVVTAADIATLPDAKPGECYAKVVIPAKYEVQTQELEIRQASEKIKVIPAKYEMGSEKVLVKEASTKIVPVPATYGTAAEKVETKPAATSWKVSLKKGATPVSPALLAAAKASGIELDAAKPGMCYREYFQPAQYKTETSEVLVSEVSEKVEVVAAKYEWAEEKVLIKEASKKVIAVPATYEIATEKVMIEPEKIVWQKGRGLVERIDTTGEIMCKVKIPAKYKTIEKRVVKTPATTKVVEIPAEYTMQKVRKLVTPAQEKRIAIPEKKSTVSKTVLVSEETFAWSALGDKTVAGSRTGNQICLTATPAKFKTVTRKVVKTAATVKVIQIPAEYKNIKVRKLVQPAQEQRIVIPAKTQVVQKSVKVSDERMEWRQVLCETNMSANVVTDIQRALQTSGFNPGPIDGVIGSATLRAIDNYQNKNSLNRGGVTYETIKALGVSI